MYPEAKKIEIFARFVYPDWTGIGLEAQLKTCTKVEEKCIHFDLFLSCYTEEEIAKEVGIPQQTVHDAIKRLTDSSQMVKIGNEPPSSFQRIMIG